MKHEWQSRRDGTKIAILSTFLLLTMQYVFPYFEINGMWLYPIPIWISICVCVWVLGRIYKFFIRKLR